MDIEDDEGSHATRKKDVMSETSTFICLTRRLIAPAKSGHCANADIMNGKVRNVMALILKTIVGRIVEARRRHQAYKELAGMSPPSLMISESAAPIFTQWSRASIPESAACRSQCVITQDGSANKRAGQPRLLALTLR